MSSVDLDALRSELRGFLKQRLADFPPAMRAWSWIGVDPDFSKELGERGWIGMTWPKRYGGHERSSMERYTVLEELLAAGAPVGAHWTADRQSGPLLLRFGTEDQRQRFLPGMARGEIYFCIGMSEPQAGSDLAAVKTRAVRDGAGWRVTGSKLWTTNAAGAHMMITLVRTGEGSQRQEGLSQLIIDLSSPGITVRPITDLAGERHFNEVFLDDVFVPDAQFVGEEGGGWKQVMSELALERSGPERYLSSIQALIEFLRMLGPQPEEPMRGLVGQLTARLWTLRQMSKAVAARIDAGEDAGLDASIVKSLGADLEQDMPRLIQAMGEGDMTDDSDLTQVLSFLLKESPSFSLRGGTREILKGIVARGDRASMNEQQLLLKDTVDRLFFELAASRPENDDAADVFAARWAQFEELGLQGLLVPEADGGFDGGGTENWLVCHAAGRFAIDLPVIEAIIAAGLLAGAGLPIPAGVLSIASRVEGKLDGDMFEGSLYAVPWGRQADHVIGILDDRLICVPTAGAEIVHHANMADEPRDEIRVGATFVASAAYEGIAMLHHGALARAAQIAGAARTAMDLAITHVTDRTQFGKPLAKFQAVQQSLATLAEQVAAAEAASRAALETGGGLLATSSAKIVANLASEAAVAIAHQMHGAIGFTWEYALHHYTRRLIAWRAEYGTARHWNGALGALAAEQGADDYWAFIVAGSETAAA